MSISNYLEDNLLNLVLRNTTFPAITSVYGSLHTADPGETGTNAPLASCPRVAIAFNAAGTATSVNSTTVDWLPQAAGTITHLALWDSSDTGTANNLFSGALTASKTVNVGDTVRAASAAITVSLA